MKIVFNGVLEKRPKGCKCSGRKSEYGFVRSKTYILPSGLQRTFRAGVTEEVSDVDGAFLLSYKYADANGYREVFSKVD